MFMFFSEYRFIKQNSKGVLLLFAFRLSSFFVRNTLLKFIGFPIRIAYKILIQWIIGLDIPDTTKIGYAFNIYHGQSLIISKDTLIGNFVIVRQNTTIGNSHNNGGSPRIGDNVEIGANSVIIGDIYIGNNSIIAAGSVVVKNVPSNVVVAGNPAKVIKYL